MKKLLLFLFSITLSLGCSSEGSDAHITFFNLSPDISKLDIFINDSLEVSALNYLDSGAQVDISAEEEEEKEIEIVARQSGGFGSLFSTPFTIVEDEDFSFFAVGFGRELDMLILNDTNFERSEDFATVRTLHAAASLEGQNVDFYILRENAAFIDVIPSVNGQRFFSVSGTLESEEGEFRIFVTREGTLDLLAVSEAFEIHKNERATIALVDLEGASQLEGETFRSGYAVRIFDQS